MLNELDRFHQASSLYYCNKFYGYYGYFIMLPIHIAILSQDNPSSEDYYTFHSFKNAYLDSGPNHSWDPGFAKVIEGFDLKDLEFFTVDEIRFFLELYPCDSDVMHKDIEYDKYLLEQQLARPKKILKSHAEIMLKANEFWRRFHHDKYKEWKQKLRDATRNSLERVRQSVLSGKASANRVDDDEGYVMI